MALFIVQLPNASVAMFRSYPLIHISVISDFVGFFVRRILLAFDKLSFCQVTALHGRYKAFYSQSTGSQTDCAGTDSHDILDSSNISDSSISFMELVSEDEHDTGKPSVL